MGANIFNMGVVGTLGGFAMYMFLRRVLGGEDRARIPASAIAGWASVVAAAAFMSLELILSAAPARSRSFCRRCSGCTLSSASARR